MIKVSVIIPFYNSEKYIEENLKSVTEQSLKDIEIICVDDGSTDSSVDIVKKFQRLDNRIKLLSQKHSGGVWHEILDLMQHVGSIFHF